MGLRDEAIDFPNNNNNIPPFMHSLRLSRLLSTVHVVSWPHLANGGLYRLRDPCVGIPLV